MLVRHGAGPCSAALAQENADNAGANFPLLDVSHTDALTCTIPLLYGIPTLHAWQNPL